MHDHCRTVERVSIEHSIANLRTFPWIARLEQAGEISIHGAWFDVAVGELYVFDELTKEWLLAPEEA